MTTTLNTKNVEQATRIPELLESVYIGLSRNHGQESSSARSFRGRMVGEPALEIRGLDAIGPVVARGPTRHDTTRNAHAAKPKATVPRGDGPER